MHNIATDKKVKKQDAVRTLEALLHLSTTGKSQEHRKGENKNALHASYALERG